MSKLLSRLDLLTNSSFKDQLPSQILQNFKNSSSQFIITLAEKLKISYSFTILAIHLTHTFFQKNSYLHHDRFFIAAAGLVLACKILDFHVDLRNIASKFYNVHCELVLGKKKDMITDVLTKSFKEKICQAEEDIVSGLKYDFAVTVPTKYVPQLISLLVEPKLKEKVFKLSKIFVLDFYRTGGSLFYKPLDIMLAAILLANYVIAGIFYLN
jgi:transcription initiation factor TFIIIB Brf1 subunit/transcription initiation factor TFIIB